MDKKFPLNIPNKYLEDKIFQALEQKGLIEDSKTQLIYQPYYTGENYRSLRRWVFDNIKSLSLTGGGVAIASAYFFPYVAAGIGSVSLLGLLAPIDRYLYHNAKDVAERNFRHIERPWYDSYDKLEIKNGKMLDDLVHMAQTPDAVNQEFPHHSQHVSLGITISRIADFLHELSTTNNCDYNITSERIVEMLTKQKVGTPKDTETIRLLRQRFTVKQLADAIDGEEFTEDNIFYPLQKHSSNYELVLKIANANGNSIGSQLSRGHLIVGEDVGVNAFSYMGMHSSGLDFPRATVEDDAGASFMTRSQRGYSRIGGNAEHRIMDYSTGGICIVEGTVQHKPGDGMTNTTWPTVLVSIGGLESEIHNVKDGIIVSLNTHLQLKERNLPKLYIFRDFKMTRVALKIKGKGNALAKSAEIIGNYIADWKGVIA